ncbi:MAG: site-specific integrase [Alphaproteobacteria bacterium]|nr:site-specific integrase [Alphaproteobacteria bacterium]
MSNCDLHSKYNAKNERAKYQYKIHMKRALKKDNKTCVAMLKHLREFEILNDFINFEALNIHIIECYVNKLLDKGLSISYVDHNLKAVKTFYTWLERQKGYRSKINYNHIDYFNITTNQRKEARATEYQESHDLNDIFKTIRGMPSLTITERRNKALISLQVLCGLRISELRTVKLKNLILDKKAGNYMIYVSPRDMVVKFAKTRHAYFMPFPEDIKSNVIEWREELEALEFEAKDPLFPIIPTKFNQYNLLEPQIKKLGIKSNTTVRDIFKRAFARAGHEYLRPHSFRHSIIRWAEEHRPKFLNATRQSLGHSSIDTTLQSYGNLAPVEQGQIIKNQEYLLDSNG